jgi:hypothetical protein
MGQPSYTTDSIFATNASTVQPLDQPQYATSHLWTQPLQFSSMSDNEIIETVLHADQGFDSTMPDIPIEDASGLSWLDWMNTPEFGF